MRILVDSRMKCGPFTPYASWLSEPIVALHKDNMKLLYTSEIDTICILRCLTRHLLVNQSSSKARISSFRLDWSFWPQSYVSSPEVETYNTQNV